jgi:CRISPR-associated protein Cmr4
MINQKFYIKCLTNLHAGIGEKINSLTDNNVQRDVLTNYPTIYSTTLKGGIRAFIEEQINKYDKDNNDNFECFFGYPVNEKDPDEKKCDSKGKVVFYEAKLLAYPVRVLNENVPYVLITTKNILEEFKEKELNINEENGNINIEGKEYNYLGKQKLNEIGEIYVLDNEDFKEIVEELPIIARNHLENGMSKNLWYEEFVPRETVFYTNFSVLNDKEILNNFIRNIENKEIQIGANATVGYGYCKFIKIKDSDINE